MSWTKSITTLVFLGMSTLLGAQVGADSELYKTLQSKDSILFDAAFNRCDPDTLESIFTRKYSKTP